jgi:hypothetical protein
MRADVVKPYYPSPIFAVFFTANELHEDVDVSRSFCAAAEARPSRSPIPARSF